MTNQRMKMYFIDFFFIQSHLLFMTNITYDSTTFANMEILVIDVICD
jgi:hypothetical protein